MAFKGPGSATKPSITVGYQSGASAVTVNGQGFAGTPRSAGAPFNGSAPVVAVQVGRKLAVIGTGGFYAPRTTR